MKMFTVKPGDPIQADADPGSTDYIANALLEELKQRVEWIEDFQAHMEGAPMGNRMELEKNQEFNGLEQLRDMSRNNYARMVVSSTVDRLGILGFRTAADQDEAGDEEARKLFDQDNMGVHSLEAMEIACGYRRAYLAVNPKTKKQSVIPTTNGAIIPDVAGEPAAAVIMRRDRMLGRDVAEFYFRDIDPETGEATGDPYVCVATREENINYRNRARDRMRGFVKITEYDTEVPLSAGVANGWTWWKSSKVEGCSRIPVTVLSNRDGKNEFEDHVDVINRINHMIFQRVVIATMQAFRQRAVKGDFPDKDPVTGARINYEEIFASGPAQMWKLPENSEIWESQPVDLSGLLEATKADIRDFASATYTPMTYFSDAATNSAEGAELQRENYISKVNDRKRRFGFKWRRHLSILMEIHNDEERSDFAGLEVIWEPTALQTMTESAATFSSLVANGIARSTAMRIALSMTPAEITRALQEKQSEDLMGSLMQSATGGTPLQKAAAGGDAVARNAAKTNVRKSATSGNAQRPESEVSGHNSQKREENQ